MRALALVLTVLAAQSAGAVEKCELVKKGYGPEGKAAVKLETVVAGLEVPWGIAFLPGGDALVTEPHQYCWVELKMGGCTQPKRPLS